MYLLCMIKARIRWCTCRVENILTLGKFLSLVLFLPPSYFVFDISNLLSYIQNISSNELARPVMGTIFLVRTARLQAQFLAILRGISKWNRVDQKLLSLTHTINLSPFTFLLA